VIADAITWAAVLTIPPMLVKWKRNFQLSRKIIRPKAPAAMET
jgi:hypothetical protein